MMKKHFVIFFSPGTFVAEHTERPIERWNIDEAMAMARGITERHGATPYAFQFTTRARNESELDSKEIKRSGTYYLGGTILTVEDIKVRNDPRDRILISNMEGNGWSKVVDNRNSWRWIQPLLEGDVVLDFKP